jgi:hypothetical protein
MAAAKRSPSPGMDPYLESPTLFPDLRASFPVYLCDEIQARLPEPCYARLNHRVFIEHEVEVREAFIEVRDARTCDRVITVIDMPSLENKHMGSEGMRLYREGQREVLRTDANLVEIDLLRAGTDVLCVSRERLQPGTATLYCVVVRRASPQRLDAHGFGLRDRLPRVAVPLSKRDPDLVVDLQKLVARAYEGGAYWKSIDYAAEPAPPLPAEDRAWARERIAEAAR